MFLLAQRQHQHTEHQPFIVWHTYPITAGLHWRHPLVGYLIGLLLLGASLGIGIVETQLLAPFFFPGMLLSLPVVIVALFWGVGPAIFTILLGLLVLDYLYIPSFSSLVGAGESGVLQLITFAIIGTVIAVLTSQREMARRRAQEAEHEALLRLLRLEATFEAMSDGVVVYNREEQVMQINGASQKLFQMDALPVMDESHANHHLLLQATQRDEKGKLLPEKRRPLTRLLAGKVLTGANTLDALVQTADGRPLMLNVGGAPIKDGHGSIEGAVLIYRDVTERRHLEQRTSSSLRSLLNVAEELVQFPADQETESAATRTYQRTGRRLAELMQGVIECQHVTLLSVEPSEEILAPIASAGLTVDEEERWHTQLADKPALYDYVGSNALVPLLKNDEPLLLEGMTLPAHASLFPYYMHLVLVVPLCIEKQLVGVMCIDNGNQEHIYTAHEITLAHTVARLTALIFERGRLQREHTETQGRLLALREANKHMEEFLGIVCHELKTPLTVVKGTVQLAEQKIRRVSQFEPALSDVMSRLAPVLALLERARTSVGVQDRLVNDLLDVARIQADRLRLLMRPCDLSSIVREAVEDQRQLASERLIYLAMPEDQQVMVHADADRLVQVIGNFLSNALKYSPPDRPVNVYLSADKNMAHIAVRDQGEGIPPAEQAVIWERFYRVPTIEVRSQYGGSRGSLGIGLYLCRAIIERHRGQIGVQSAPGKGSTFWFTLPLAQEVYSGEEERKI